jgi:hypothetical protein
VLALQEQHGAEIYEFRLDGGSVFSALTISSLREIASIWPVPTRYLRFTFQGDFDLKVTVQMAKDAFVQLKDIKYRTQAYELQGVSI